MGVTEEVARTGHGGGGPWGVAEEVVRAGRGGGGPCRSRRRRSVQVAEERSHSEIQNLTGVFGFLSYEKIVYRHKTEIACKILNS